jgi:hypothetical protein
MNVSMDPADLRDLHDRLLSLASEEVEHDPGSCPFCGNEPETELSLGGESVVSEKSFSQEDLDAAVAAAVKPLEEKIKELSVQHEQTEIEARFAKEKADLEAQVAEIQGQLDGAVLKAAESDKKFEELVAYLDAAMAEEAAAAELARRKEERLTLVREVASFPDEYVEANAERWAGLSDEDFEALVNDWRAIASKPVEDTLPAATAMVASRPASNGSSAIREILDLTIRGFDPKSL